MTYYKVGNVLGGGRSTWLRHRQGCPYCKSSLESLGSFHRGGLNIGQAADGSTMCLGCGTTDVPLDVNGPSRRITKLSTLRTAAALSPIACLFRVDVCPICGWWFAVQNADVCNNGQIATAIGLLESFDLSAADVPLQLLTTEVSRHADRITGIHPKRMEDLVASVLRGTFDCEVHQLGYQKDGGIDLILLQGASRIAVQVKRRTDGSRKEPVKLVREFLGAALVGGYSKLMIVSNAAGFTRGSVKEARIAIDKGIVESYDLIDFKKFASLLPSVAMPVWQTALRDAVDRRDARDVPDPYRLFSST